MHTHLILLADSRVQDWPINDNICLSEIHPDWNMRQLVTALRVGSIWITCDTVVLYLEKMHEFAAKNALENLCHIIRQHRRDACIFVSNSLPALPCSPLRKSVQEGNFLLLQAVCSVNRAIPKGKVHYLSVFEHFVSKKGKIIWPTHQYFKENAQLMVYGCMIFRECLMREARLKTYWFE